jgi:hypothetical protein
MATESLSPLPPCPGHIRPLPVNRRHHKTPLHRLGLLTKGFELGCSVVPCAPPYGSSRVSTMRRWTLMSSGPPWLSSSPTSRRGVLGHWSSGSGELLHGDLGHYHCVLPLLPMLELGSTMGQGSNTSSSPLLCSTATLAFPLISPLDFPNLGN